MKYYVSFVAFILSSQMALAMGDRSVLNSGDTMSDFSTFQMKEASGNLNQISRTPEEIAEGREQQDQQERQYQEDQEREKKQWEKDKRQMEEARQIEDYRFDVPEK